MCDSSCQRVGAQQGRKSKAPAWRLKVGGGVGAGILSWPTSSSVFVFFCFQHSQVQPFLPRRLPVS